MKTHQGMRPQDIVVLLKIAAFKQREWMGKDLSNGLFISQSEVSEALSRCVFAGLLAPDRKTLMRQSFLEFLQYGLKYCFPQKPGAMVRGIPTAHSAEPLAHQILSDEPYVWPSAEGTIRGQTIQPLYPSVPKACLHDPELYALLALVDALRVGKSREQELAFTELKNRIAN